MFRRSVAIATVVVAAATMLVSPSAQAQGPVTISVTGPSRIETWAGRGTATSWATFTIMDSSGTATNVRACRILSTGARRDCDVVDLVPTSFPDGNWQVMAIPGGWLYRSRIGYRSMSAEECWDAARSERPYRISIAVRNPAQVELAQASHPYRVDCRGYTGRASGKSHLMTHSFRRSANLVMSFTVIDKDHDLRSYRECIYADYDGDLLDCVRYRLTKNGKEYRNFGWVIRQKVWWGPLGTDLCRFVGRRWPEFAGHITLYDRDLTKRLTLTHDFHLECRP